MVPGPDKLAPLLEFHSLGEGVWEVVWHAAAVSELALESAVFPASDRVGLAPGASGIWRLDFVERGPEPPATAAVRVVAMGPGLTPSTWETIDLAPVEGGRWTSADRLGLEAAVDLAPGDAAVSLELTVDGRRVDLSFGLPIGLEDGLAAGEFSDWIPAAPRPGTPPTRFSAAAPTALPGTTVAGWSLGTVDPGAATAYGDCAEVTLTSPWVAPGEGVEVLRFTSRVHTEDADPGEAYDGGLVEIRRPGGPWVPLTPTGGPVILVTPLGGAATAGAAGLGRGPWPWTGYEATLPPRTTPYQLRFRFGSDATIATAAPADPWDLADARVVPAGEEEARLEHLAASPGRLRLRLRAAVTAARIWGRPVPSVGAWQPLTASRALVAGEAVFDLPAPAAAAMLLGAFADSTADELLATTGWSGPAAAASILRPRPNPARGALDLATTPRGGPRRILIHDLKGRLVRHLHLPPDVGLVHWDGRDDNGVAVAAGGYLARLEGAPGPPAAFVLLR
jgi:hypothetical protein